MTATERIAQLREELKAIAWGLAELGVPPDTIVDDARVGIGQAVEHRARAGR